MTVSDADRARAGLCGSCANARTVVSARGSVFWLCGRAATDARFRRYPPLPVLRCAGFELLASEPGDQAGG